MTADTPNSHTRRVFPVAECTKSEPASGTNSPRDCQEILVALRQRAACGIYGTQFLLPRACHHIEWSMRVGNVKRWLSTLRSVSLVPLQLAPCRQGSGLFAQVPRVINLEHVTEARSD